MKMSSLSAAFKTVCSGLFVWLVFPALLCRAELQVGTASVDITPNKAVALWGQFGLRLSTKPDTPLTANVVALQSGDARTTFVSLDLLQLPEVFVQAVRDAVAKKDAAINVQNMVLTATHTHTAPVLHPGTPGIPVNDQTHDRRRDHHVSGRQDQRRHCGRLEERRAGKDVVWAGPE